MYWEFDGNELPAGWSLEPDPSNGDECHCNILGLSDSRLKKFFKNKHVRLDEVSGCIGGQRVDGEALKQHFDWAR